MGHNPMKEGHGPAPIHMYTSVVEALLSEQHYQLIDHLALMCTINKTVSI